MIECMCIRVDQNTLLAHYILRYRNTRKFKIQKNKIKNKVFLRTGLIYIVHTYIICTYVCINVIFSMRMNVSMFLPAVKINKQMNKGAVKVNTRIRYELAHLCPLTANICKHTYINITQQCMRKKFTTIMTANPLISNHFA